MPVHTPSQSFLDMTKLKRTELDRLMWSGTPPALAELAGFEFRGWNYNAAARLLGTRKFKKGFFGQASEGVLWGYNVLVRQNELTEAWQEALADHPRRRYAFFKVYPADRGHRPVYPGSTIIHYRDSGEYFPLDPVGYTVDYLVYPDPANHDIVLGKSYWEAGKVRFFMGYFLIERDAEPSGYARRSHFLSGRQMRTVEKFAEVCIEAHRQAAAASRMPQPGTDRASSLSTAPAPLPDPVLSPAEISWSIDAFLARVRSNRVRSLRLVLWVIEYLLAFPQRFSKLDVNERRHHVNRHLARPRRGSLLRDLGRDLGRIRMLFMAGYYGDPRTYDSLRFVPVSRRGQFPGDPPPAPPPPLAIHLHEPPGEVVTAELCVIGSGAGGAVVAHEAAAAGRDVVLIEEGDYVPAASLNHDEPEMVTLLYKESGLQTSVDFDTAILQGQTLGGSTVINNAICLPIKGPQVNPGTGDDLLTRWRKLGAVIDETDLNESYRKVSERLGVARISESLAGPNGAVLLEGWLRLVERGEADPGIPHGLFHKNYDHCAGCGYCNFGCPYGRKRSVLEAYIAPASRLGARVITGTHARRIESVGRRAIGVRCERRDGRPLLVRADRIVVACGAIGSSVLLMRSKLGGRNVGRRFSFNAGAPVYARFPRPLDSWNGVQMASYVDCGDYILESLFNPPASLAMALPGWFETHYARMHDYTRLACIGVLIGTDHNAQIKGWSLTRSLFGPIKYKMTPDDLERLTRGLARAARVLLAAGAEEVYTTAFSGRAIRRPDEAEEIIARAIRSPRDLVFGSSHPQGGNAMSNDPGLGVVDSDLRVHGTENLFVCDASVFPTTIRVNPQLTIMALADSFTRRVLLGGK